MRVTAAATPHHTAGSVTSITPSGAEAAEAGVASAIEVGAMQDPLDNVMAAAFAVETLRIRHWLLRQAIGCLNHLFGMQLGMSVCALCVMSFFDIYYETFHVMGKYLMSDLITYSWMLHYAVRYLGIILISHYTTKQVGTYYLFTYIIYINSSAIYYRLINNIICVLTSGVRDT